MRLTDIHNFIKTAEKIRVKLEELVQKYAEIREFYYDALFVDTGRLGVKFFQMNSARGYLGPMFPRIIQTDDIEPTHQVTLDHLDLILSPIDLIQPDEWVSRQQELYDHELEQQRLDKEERLKKEQLAVQTKELKQKINSILDDHYARDRMHDHSELIADTLVRIEKALKEDEA